MRFSEYFKELQDRAGLRNADIAVRLGKTPNVISMVRTGAMPVPVQWLPVLAELFSVTLLELLECLYQERDPEDWSVICQAFGADRATGFAVLR